MSDSQFSLEGVRGISKIRGENWCLTPNFPQPARSGVSIMENPAPFVHHRLGTVSLPARKLFDVIVRQAHHGPLRGKSHGTATPPEILEACGLDVGDFYSLLNLLKDAGLIQVSNSYPFEEIRLTPEAEEAFS